MKRFGYLIIIVIALFSAMPMSGKLFKIPPIEIKLPGKMDWNIKHTQNYDYGLRIDVSSNVNDDDIVDMSSLSSKQRKLIPEIEFDRPVEQSVREYLESLVSASGIRTSIGRDKSYTLRVIINDYTFKIKNYDVKRGKIIGSSNSKMSVQWELLDPDRNPVIPLMTSTGYSDGEDSETFNPLYNSYIKALSDIDWEQIEPFLSIADTAKQEKNKSVSGMGDSALEHTVIRWYIVSKPQGADVYWRLISSTPEVSNTNSSYVGTTPYESTEAFDIRGLSYNNSGNVQIEVSCEKDGYIPQRKRFNLRQAIDQKEISAKFNLVKEETEEE